MRGLLKLMKEWDLPCEVVRVDVRRHAAQMKMGIEEAARGLRYRALAKMAVLGGRCAAVVTAHTADDQAETVLMNFLRGWIPPGLAGIPSSAAQRQKRIAGDPAVFRHEKKADSAVFKDHSIAYCRDPSNRTAGFRGTESATQRYPIWKSFIPGSRTVWRRRRRSSGGKKSIGAAAWSGSGQNSAKVRANNHGCFAPAFTLS